MSEGVCVGHRNVVELSARPSELAVATATIPRGLSADAGCYHRPFRTGGFAQFCGSSCSGHGSESRNNTFGNPAVCTARWEPGALDVEVGRSAPANEPPPVRDGGGSAAFDEENTRAFIESRRWGRDVGTSAGLAPMFRSGIQSPAARGGTAVAPAAPARCSSEHPWLPPPPSQVAQRPVVDHVHASARPDPSHVPADARQSAFIPRVGEQAEHGLPAEDDPPPVFPDGLHRGERRGDGGFQKDESVKHIFWIPCVAHIMDLILEDIGGIDWVASRIPQARLVTRFFKCHGHVREVLEAYSKKTLLRSVETRFGTNVIMMTRLVKLRAKLTQVVGDDRWRETVWSTSKICKDTAEVTACIGSPPWWEDSRALCKMLEPIMDMLRLVDSDTRQISKILRRYEEMIASCLSACRDIDQDQQDAIVEVFLRRRTMFKTPAHTAAMMLDPEFQDATLCDDAEVMEDEAAVDQQLVRGTGALAKVTEEELSLARERMRAVSRMGAERRVAESDRRGRRAGGQGRGGRGRAGVGGPTRGDVRFASRTRRQRADGHIRRARMRWDEGDFLFDNTSSDDDDFFALGIHAAMDDDRGGGGGDGDDVGDGDGPGDTYRAGDGGRKDRLRCGGRRDDSIASRVRRRRVHIATDTGARVMQQDPVVVSEDDMGDPSNEMRRDPVDVEAQASPAAAMVTEEDTGVRITHPRSPAPVVGTEEETEFGGPAQRSLGGSLEAVSADFVAHGDHGSQQLSDGVSSVHPPDEGPQREPHRGPTETLAARPLGVIRSDGGEGVGQDTAQPGSADAGRSFGGPIERRGSSTTHPDIVRPNAHDVGDGHTDEPLPHLMGMRDIMRPPPSRPLAADPVAHGQATQSALPTRSFYNGAGMDRRAGDIEQASACGPTDVPAGARSIGNVDGTCRDSMRAYEEQHGRPIRAKTIDVHDTRTATARLSRAKKKGTGASIPYHRRRPQPFFRNRDETRQMPTVADG
ncbi:hypothetical protein CBR_g23574 [Chara braunii]|uniref:DUF659 domain-containing protein n=1 Tax=Chara braunii TaxID=69332 RepID=A0A388L4L3_CHABU|nr:hypothetical protein CBR_g23574 [Chara braunii]|eukprot:GBG77246.1 hypothetical protein CBR_g23574 [Chara braunii]